MKRIVLLVVFISVLAFGAYANEERAYGTSFGFTLNEYVDDLGLGVQVTSPYLFDILALRLAGTMQFSKLSDWSPWWTTQLGLVGASKIVGGFARFYGEGGVILAFPSSGDSSVSHGWGGYGTFGFEFFTGERSPISYFIEVGATGSSLQADLQPGSPLILNGLRIQVGFRGYPWKSKKADKVTS